MKNYRELIQSFAQEDYEKGLVNLHIHSTCSDGTYTVSEILKIAKKNHVGVLSIADHNVIDAYKELNEEND